MRERVGILDLSGFAKYDVTGRDARTLLNRLCANRVPKRGGIALTHLLSEGGAHRRGTDDHPPRR